MVSVLLYGYSLPVTACPDELIFSRSGLNVSSSSDPQDTSIQAFLDFPSCDGAALVVVYGIRPGVLPQCFSLLLPCLSFPQL